MNYTRLVNASHYYSDLEYEMIGVPWAVSRDAIDATLPPNAMPVPFMDKFLVGSAEQSFVELMLQGKLPEGKYQAISPCFRDEMEDEIHHKYFIKLELITTDWIDTRLYKWAVESMIDDAAGYFRDCGVEVDSIETKDGFDIVQRKTGIELGSYGYREYKDFKWVYGTGIAEPRFTYAWNKERE